MNKVVIHAAGGYDELRVETHPDPAVGPGEVRVRARAIGVNYADCIVRMGLYASAREYVGWPITPGFEVAGDVDAVGDDVRGVSLGESVIAVTRFGGYATHVVVPERQVFARPRELGVHEAAAFSAVHLTAWFALAELARPSRGATVLVHSAAGGVGTALVQIAKALGCRVVGVVGGAHKVETARVSGADAVIDKRADDWRDAAARLSPGGYEVVLDANGVETLRQSYALVRAGGRLVIYGFHSMLPRSRGTPSWPALALAWLRTPRFNPLRMTNDNRSVLALNLSYLFDRSDLLARGMEQLFSWLREGALRSPPVQAFPLARVADAHRALESGRTVGKLVLTT